MNISAPVPPIHAMRDRLAGAVEMLRTKHPRIHALMPPVSQPLAANVCAALRIDVSMTTDAGEVGAMAAGSDALLVNLGMLDAARREGTLAAVATGTPFVLDPVKVDRSPTRLAFAKSLLAHGPAVVKGNAAEIATLGALPPDTVTLTTGRHDTIAGDGERLVLANGHPMLDRVIATGCAAGALIAGYLGATRDPALAALAGLSHLNIAGEMAATRAGGPGTFAAHLIDRLAALTGEEVAARLRPAPEPVDVSLYLILGPHLSDPVAIAQAAVAGGVTLLQWRDKTGSTMAQVEMARRLAATGVPVMVNDRADVAATAGVGLHVGHGDLSPAEARAIAPEAPIGLTIHTMEEAEAADVDAIAYASVGGVFTTTSKHNPSPPIGLEGFCAIRDRLKARRPDLPVCAIAGITPERAASLREAGADGIAVMSAITEAPDPTAAARALRSSS